MGWRTASVSSIGRTLFERFGFDPDRAVCIAYWLKRGEMLKASYYVYAARAHRSPLCEDMTEGEALDLLRRYNAFMGRR